ncbi:DUF7095 family protein [Halobacterium rubrum]|uniref:DUF7095 family protein n=1 Tax=Halobacterium TaxID=2239 RepID=UPI001F3DCB65|nr:MULTISPECIES: hypothetical protein [Halobacterium]MDH5020188.1 hypothetical protein [Halobacterium rubrum]
MDRDAAVDRVEALLDTVVDDEMPVPVREVWVYGDVALGLDPVDRLDVYLTKDVLLRGDDADRADEFEREYGVAGVGKTVRASWADAHPEHLRANENGHVAPERCLAAHLVDDDEPIHLEVCNAGFEDNVTQRLEGALATETYEHVLDPRGVCLYADGQRGEDALQKLRDGELVFPTFPEALEMLGAEEDEAELAADAVKERRERATGATVRGDVV